MLARVVQPVKSRLLSVSELSLSVFLRLLLLAKQQNCASPLLLCWWKKEKKGKRGGRKKKVGYTTLTLAPRKVCDTLDSQFAKKLKVFTIILKAGFFAQYTSELLEILFWRFFLFFFLLTERYFENYQVSRRHLLGNSWKNQRADRGTGRSSSNQTVTRRKELFLCTSV